ncbi:protein pirA-like isoform X1 [Schistocerca gregaria]|uniref:protein pirA-like isoform X1 n=1 Tax=Schistocerca gregaria TaxID=7010 RepID=UPI00211DCF16|nr:protein pirA-like isoform X1 [Schistocerca gregaria]
MNSISAFRSQSGSKPPVKCPKVIPNSRLEAICYLLFKILSRPKKRKIFGDSGFQPSGEKAIADLYKFLQWYLRLIHYDSNLEDIADLGDLWYREFYLEITKCLQFEIESSLAWNLIDHILVHSPSMTELIPHVLEIYNNASRRALTSLNQKFLFDEISSEVNLAFDQLTYKLAISCFTYFKQNASLLQLEAEYSSKLVDVQSDEESYHLQHSNYIYVSQLLEHRDLRVLGCAINLNQLIAERINQILAKNLDYVISLFESTSVTSVIEFELLFENVKLCHKLMVEAGLPLEPWEDILFRVDMDHSFSSTRGRIVLHTLYSLVTDLLPNYTFSSTFNRFSKAQVLEERNVPRNPRPSVNHMFLYGNRTLYTAFNQIYELTSQFFGYQHAKSILSLIGKQNIHFLICELVDNMHLILSNSIKPYISEVAHGLSSDKMNMPQPHYGVDATYEYFRAKVKNIVNYPVLGTRVFQHLREWGNFIPLFQLLDSALSQLDVTSYAHSILFQKNLSKNSLCASLSRSVQIYSTPSIDSTKHYSLLHLAVHLIHETIQPYKLIWKQDQYSTSPDTSLEFYRVWNALLFVFSLNVSINEFCNKSSLEIFGEGFLWAGSSITYLLGQHSLLRAGNFSQYMSYVAQVMPPPSSDSLTRDSALFLFRLKKINPLCHRIFSFLQSIYPLPIHTNAQLNPI